MDLGRGEPFDYSHGSTTSRAGPESESRRSPWRRVGNWVRLRGGVQQLKTEWQECGAAAVGQEAEIANANEARRKQMQEETAEELLQRQRHPPLLVVMRRIPPAKRDLAIRQGDQSVVGDGDPVGVGTEIAQGVLRTSEGSFAVDNPVMAKQLPEPGRENLGLREELEVAMEAELALDEGALQSGHELAAKHPAQHFVGKKEGAAGLDPSRVIGGQTAGREYAMDMRMKLELLIPGVQYAEETDLGAQMLGIDGHLEQSFGASMEQEVVDHFLVLQSERRQFPRQSENDMHVRGGQQLAAARLQPTVAGIALAFWTMAIATRVVRDGGVPAAGTLVAMTAQCGRAASFDGEQHFPVLPGDPLATAFEE